MKLLIIRLSSIGDIVLTTPVIRCVKQQLPDAEVHFLTKKTYGGLLEYNPYINKLHLLHDSLSQTIHDLRAEQFDYLIDLHHNMRTLRIKQGLGVKSFAFNKLNIEKWLLTALKINQLPDVHIVDRYLDTVKPLGIKNDGMGLDFFYDPAAENCLDSLPPSHRQGYIGLVIGAALATKQLPLQKIADICSLLPYPVVLLGGKEDAGNGAKIAAMHPGHVYNACGQYSLAQSAVLVKHARVVVTHDTGLMHIAAALGRPVVSIWGNTVPAFGMGPYYAGGNTPPSALFEVSGVSCRPCSKIGYKKCPKGHFKCMMLQDEKAIAAKTMALLQTTTK